MARVRRLSANERRSLSDPLFVARQLDQALILVDRLAVCLDCADGLDLAAAARRLHVRPRWLAEDLSLALAHGRKVAP